MRLEGKQISSASKDLPRCSTDFPCKKKKNHSGGELKNVVNSLMKSIKIVMKHEHTDTHR